MAIDGSESSRAARQIRTHISPRLAIRILSLFIFYELNINWSRTAELHLESCMARTEIRTTCLKAWYKFEVLW